MQFENAFDFEKHIKVVLENKFKNCSVEIAPPNTKGYDLEINLNNKLYASQVKNHKAKIHTGHIKKFLDFLEISAKKDKKFSGGFFISSSGYYNKVITFLETSEIKNLVLFEYKKGKLEIFWKYGKDNLPAPEPLKKKIYIGVFTAKGGVGKTTVSSHLAGGFALNGYEVVLIDLDKQSHLRNLLGEGVYIPSYRKEVGANITVLNSDEWEEQNYKDTDIIICDCNPNLSENPKELIEKFDYCIIPTTLNPLGINKNAYVIENTFQEIRNINKKASLFVLINSFYPKEQKRNKNLNKLLKKKLEELQKKDDKFFYIDPLGADGVAIRFSVQLLYWGYHIIEDEEPQLAFTHKGGRSYPREDFLVLTNYLLEHTEIEKHKSK